jgi:hypothetical protein
MKKENEKTQAKDGAERTVFFSKRDSSKRGSTKTLPRLQKRIKKTRRELFSRPKNRESGAAGLVLTESNRKNAHGAAFSD